MSSVSRHAHHARVNQDLLSCLSKTATEPFPSVSGIVDRSDPTEQNFEVLTNEYLIYVKSDVLEKAVIDKYLNWCRVSVKVSPVSTDDCNNTLFEAVCLALWRTSRYPLLLMQIVESALEKELFQNVEKRWKCYKGGVRIDSSASLRTALKKCLVNGMSQCSIHLQVVIVFIISNIIRRPIIIVGDTGDDSEEINLCGIYLPLLCPSEQCQKSPVLLLYNDNSFFALFRNKSDPTPLIGVPSTFPLLRHDLRHLPIHLLLPEEQNNSNVLNNYMNLCEVNFTQKDSISMVASCFLGNSVRENKTPLNAAANSSQSARSLPYISHLISENINVNHSLSNNSSVNGHSEGQFHSLQNNPRAETNDVGYETRQCQQPGCSFSGRADTNWLCSTHFQQQLTANVTPLINSPTAPQASIVSRKSATFPNEEYQVGSSCTGVLCRYQGCPNMCSRHTEPYCHEHETLLANEPTGTRARPPVRNEESEYQPSCTGTECEHPGCANLASINTYPYCYEHQPQPTNQHNQINTRNTGQLENGYLSMMETECAHQDCPNLASRNTYPFCHEHAAPRSHAANQHEPGNQINQELYLSYTGEECRMEGCANYSSVNTYPFCHDHYDPTSRNPTGIVNASSGRPQNQGHTSAVNNTNDFFLKTMTEIEQNSKRTSSQCKTPGCQNYGNPRCMGYCSSCYRYRQGLR